MHILLIVISNIKKRKSTAISTILLSFLTISLLYLSISTLTTVNSYIDHKAKELHSADFQISCLDFEQKNLLSDKVKTAPEVKDLEESNGLIYFNTEIKCRSFTLTTNFFAAKADEAEKTKIQPLKYLEKGKTIPQKAIILPFLFKINGNIKIGDKITLDGENISGTYTVYGFFEDVYASSTRNKIYKIYFFDKEYQSLIESENSNLAKGYMIQGKLKADGSSTFMKSIYNFVNSTELGKGYNPNSMVMWEYGEVKEISTMFLNIIMLILIAFSIVLFLVMIFVIQFTIRTFINENIQQIGILKANGFVDHQIELVFIAQFVALMFIGIIFSIFISILSSTYVAKIISSSICLVWKANMKWEVFIICSMVLLIITASVVWCVTKLSLRDSIVEALKGGKDKISKKSSKLSLMNCRHLLNVTLGIKSIISRKHQSIILGIIIFLISITCTFSVILYFNFVENNKLLMDMLGFQDCNCSIGISDDNYEEIFNEIESMDEVKKICYYRTMNGDVDHTQIMLTISRDFKKLDNSTIVTGRLPETGDEIVLSNMFALRHNYKIGDKISVKIGDNKSKYKIVGLNQVIMNLGNSAFVLEAGVQKCISDYHVKKIYIYLNDDVDNKVFIDKLEKKYSENNCTVTDEKKANVITIDSLKTAITVICILIAIITIVIVSIILFIIVKTRIMNEKTSIGIKKAIGYSSGNIAVQVIWGIIPVVMINVVLGISMCSIFFNKAITKLLEWIDIGITKCIFTIPILYVVVSGAAIILVAYICLFLISRRVQKVSPTSILRED